jgi:hypothetical protein
MFSTSGCSSFQSIKVCGHMSGQNVWTGSLSTHTFTIRSVTVSACIVLHCHVGWEHQPHACQVIWGRIVSTMWIWENSCSTLVSVVPAGMLSVVTIPSTTYYNQNHNPHLWFLSFSQMRRCMDVFSSS